MGYYINPIEMSKEVWLSAYPKVDPYITGFVDGDERLVCLVDNGPFTAAAVAVDKIEYDTFLRPDGRTKVWYKVPVTDLITVGAIPKPND